MISKLINTPARLNKKLDELEDTKKALESEAKLYEMVSAVFFVLLVIGFVFFLVISLYLEVEKPKLNNYGGRKETCYPNKTCDKNLSCIDNICVKINKTLEKK